MTSIGHTSDGLRARIKSLARQMDWMRGLEGAIESAALLRLGASADARDTTPAHSAGHAYVYQRLGRHRQGLEFELLAANFTRESESGFCS
jgi:hypothetical protein